MRLGNDADLGARALALVREPKQRPDLVNRESEGAGPAPPSLRAGAGKSPTRS
jgi:hypothetical protein